MPTGKPLFANGYANKFCTTFEKNRLVSANVCLKIRNLVTKERGGEAGLKLLFLCAWEQIFEAIPQLVINGRYISRQEETPIVSLLSAVASGVSILIFFVTLPCKVTAFGNSISN